MNLTFHSQPRIATIARRGIPAWVLSFAFHGILLVLLTFLVNKVYRGGAEVANRSGGIVLVAADDRSTEYLSEGETTIPASAAGSAQLPSLATAEQRPDRGPGPELSEALDSIGNELVAAIPGADGFPESNQPTRGEIGGQATTDVFGVKGTGSQFVYLFDRSASMEGFEARPLQAAKLQLRRSLESLGPNHLFQIIFYNEGTRIFTPGAFTPKLEFATDQNKNRAIRFVESMQGEGGTDHLQGIKTALGFGPDVIFLLTDAEGGFTKAELAQVAHWNRKGTIINAIEFGSGSKSSSSDFSLQSLARQNGGSYLYKDIDSLSGD